MSIKSVNRESTNIKIGVILSLLSFVVSMVVNVIFIRFINKPEIAGQSQYGLYTFSTSMTSLLLALSFGMNSSYVRFATIAKKEDGDNGLKRINGSFALLFIIAAIVVTLIGIGIILSFYYGLIGSNFDDFKRRIIILCLCFSVANVAVSLISNIFTLYTNFNMRFIWARVLTITVSITTPLITAIIIYFNHNIVTYVCVELCVNIVALVVNMIFCVKALNYKVKISLQKVDFHILRNILVFSFFIFLVTAVTELTSNTPKMLLGLLPNANGDSEITVAYYQLSATFIGAIAVASSAVSATYVPLVNRYVAYGTNEDVNSLFLKATKNMIVAYAVIMGGFIACGREFIILWQGSHYENTDLIYYVACLLSIISFVPSTFSITSEVQRAKNKHRFRSFVLLIGFIINFVTSLTLLLILPNFVSKDNPNYYVYQVVACAIGFGIGNIVNAVIMSIYNHKVIKLNMFKYYKIIAFYLLMIAIPLIVIFLFFKYVPLKMGLIWEFVARGSMFVVLFVALLLIFDRKFVFNLFKKENTQVAKEKIIKLQSAQVGANKKVFVLRDLYKVLNGIIGNGVHASIFDDESIKKMKQLNDRYSISFVLLISKEINLKSIPKNVLNELAENSSWLSVAFSSGKHFPYSFIDAPFISNDLSAFASCFLRNNVRVENIVFPDFAVNDTQISYFKSFYDFKIAGLSIFDDLSEVELPQIIIRNNIIQFSCSSILTDNNSAILYFNTSDINSIEDTIIKNSPSALHDILKNILSDKEHPELFEKRVAVINTYNGLSTGRLAKTIMQSCEGVGMVTKLFYGRLKDENDTSSYYFGTSKIINTINNIYVKISGNIGHAHYFETKNLIKKIEEFNPDIVHLHNIGGNCLNYRLLFDYLRDKKVVVTMHDCFWLTGRCHHFTYSGDNCDGWKSGCGNCKHLDYYMRSYFFDKSSRLFKEKRDFINSCKSLNLVCISKWQKEFFDISGIPETKLKLIYNGIQQPELANISLNDSKIRLIFVSSFLTKDKGIDEINKLAEILDPNKFLLEVIGKLPREMHLNKNIKYLGALENKIVLERIKCSDMFIYPTHADTLPTVLIESLMVGTPVISYDIGGCADIIEDDGIVVNYGDFDSLISAIQNIETCSFNRDQISKRAKDRFCVENMTDKYISLYCEVVENE